MDVLIVILQSWLPSFSLLQRTGNGAFSLIIIILIGSPWPPLFRGLDSLVHPYGDKTYVGCKCPAAKLFLRLSSTIISIG